jgi:hypothetical protein
MSRYEVQFKSSGIVAFSATERGICQHWMDCNNHAEDVPVVDPDTGEVTGYNRGECLNLFVLIKAG